MFFFNIYILKALKRSLAFIYQVRDAGFMPILPLFCCCCFLFCLSVWFLALRQGPTHLELILIQISETSLELLILLVLIPQVWDYRMCDQAQVRAHFNPEKI